VSRRSVDRGRTRTAEPAVTSTFDVSLSVRPAAGLDDEALIDLFRGGATRTLCRELIRERGAHVNRITITWI